MHSLLIISLVVLIIIPLYTLIFIVIPFFYGASYEGSQPDVIKKMLKYSKAKKSDRIVDLGSGDGRIVMAYAKLGIPSEGYEVNPVLVLLSRFRIRRNNLQALAKIHWKSFWDADLSRFTIINIFQFHTVMPRLEKKLQKELPKGARIISNTWKFPNWKLLRQDNDVFVYEKK